MTIFEPDYMYLRYPARTQSAEVQRVVQHPPSDLVEHISSVRRGGMKHGRLVPWYDQTKWENNCD